MYLKMGWRNLWRNPGRTLLQVLAVGGSLCIAVFFNNFAFGSYRQMIREGVKSGSGHIGIYHPSYLEDRKIEQFFELASIPAALKMLPGVREVFPRLHIPGLARSSHESCGALIMGLDIAAESGSHPLLDKKRIKHGELPKKNQVLIGCRLAEILQVKTGNKIVVMFQDVNGEIGSTLFRISGIFQSGSGQMDTGLILAERDSLGRAFGFSDAAHELAIMLSKPDESDRILGILNSSDILTASASALPWEKAMPQLAGAIRMDRMQFRFMILILFVIVGIGAVNTLLMSVMERTREFGLMRALGFGPGPIRKMVMAEGIVLGLAGMILGTGAGLLLTWFTVHHGVDFSSLMGEAEMGGILIDPVIKSAWDPVTTLWFNAAMFILVLAASLYPSGKALQIKPAQAMRTY